MLNHKLYPEWPIKRETDVEELLKVYYSDNWGLDGEMQIKLEEAFAEFIGCKYAVTCANGTVAIRLALESLQIHPYDEVIVPGLTWQATAGAVLDINAIPVLADINKEDLTVDIDSIKKNINKKTKAIIVVHLYGRIANLDKITEICRANNIFLIEDCAHQPGSKWKDISIGNFGKIGTFSLQQAKILNAGEGGLLTTNDRNTYLKLKSLRSCGRSQDGISVHSGNYRMTEFQAALALSQLKELSNQNEIRERNVIKIEKALSGSDVLNPLHRNKNITFQTYYKLSLEVNMERIINRKELMKNVERNFENCIPWGIPYEPLNNSDLYKPLNKETHRLNAEYIKKINPINFKLLNCAYAHKNIINFSHNFLLMEDKNIDKFITSIYKTVSKK